MARRCRAGSANALRQRGFSYFGLLIAVVVVGATLAAAGQLWRTASVREREAELLFIGVQIRTAIGSYHDETPGGQVPAFPRSLDALVEDNRWPTTHRHLRKVYVDPMTASRDWGLVAAPTGGVMGVYSLSDQTPLKHANFPGGSQFAQAKSYRDWKFVYVPQSAASAPAGASSAPTGPAFGSR